MSFLAFIVLCERGFCSFPLFQWVWFCWEGSGRHFSVCEFHHHPDQRQGLQRIIRALSAAGLQRKHQLGDQRPALHSHSGPCSWRGTHTCIQKHTGVFRDVCVCVSVCVLCSTTAGGRVTAGNAEHCSSGIPCLERGVTPLFSSCWYPLLSFSFSLSILVLLLSGSWCFPVCYATSPIMLLNCT